MKTAKHRPAKRRRRYRHDELTCVDLFSGFGGLTLGDSPCGVHGNHSGDSLSDRYVAVT